MCSHGPTSTTPPCAVEIDIIIVDDSANDAELTLLALNHLQPRPRALWLNDGRQAIDYLMRRRRYERGSCALPSVVLTDIHMPSLSGLELLALIRSEPGLGAVPVIVLSGKATAREIRECCRLGAIGYVEKSFAYETFTAQLIQAVAKCLHTPGGGDPLQRDTP